MKYVKTFENFINEKYGTVDEGNEFVAIGSKGNAIKVAIKEVEKFQRLKANKDKEPEFEQLSLNKIMLSKVLGREKLGKEHEDAWKRLKAKFDLSESVADDWGSDGKVLETTVSEGNTVTFTIDDGDLDDKFLSDKSLSRNLDYKEDRGDTYYVLPKRDFDRFQDWADSSGYDTDEIIDVIEESLNEAATFDVNVQEPFNKKDEQKAQNKFKIEAQPITMVDADGEISEDTTDVTVVFSNGDSANYTWEQNFGNSSTMIISPKGSSDIDITRHVDNYLGSTGTIIGDIGLIYKDWKQGKIKA